jgi:hypothetical protein
MQIKNTYAMREVALGRSSSGRGSMPGWQTAILLLSKVSRYLLILGTHTVVSRYSRRGADIIEEIMCIHAKRAEQYLHPASWPRRFIAQRVFVPSQGNGLGKGTDRNKMIRITMLELLVSILRKHVNENAGRNVSQ